MPNHNRHHRDQRARLTTAAIIGLLAGAARAITDLLLRHLTGSR